MEGDVEGCTSVHEVAQKLTLSGSTGHTSGSLCKVLRRLTYDKVVDLLMNTPEEECTCWPPSGPKKGDVFIFTFQEEKHHFDFVADGMNWRNQGTRLYSNKDGIVVKKRYYQRRIGKQSVDFRKCVYEMSTLTRVLIHYFGERDEELPEAPHGNRKKHLDKGHIRVMPSVLADIKESKDTVGDIYMKMVSECRVPPQNFQVAMPRNIKQVENRKQYEKKQETVERCDVGEIYSLLQLNTELGGFVKYLEIIPSVNLVLINEQLVQEWAEIASSGERCLLSYITRFKFRDFYISILIGRHHQFESEPGLPLAFLIHHRTTASSYKLLLKEVRNMAPVLDSTNVLLITEKEPAIHTAWAELLTTARQFTCWESLKKAAVHQLKKLRITGHQKKVYLEDITSLLLARSDNEYHTLYDQCKQTWGPEFTVAYDTQLYDSVRGTTRGELTAEGAYSQDNGIRVLECEGLNTLLQGLAAWAEPSLEGVTLALYMLGCYYQCEVARGLGNTGAWRLKRDYSVRQTDAEDLHLPAGAAEPSQIIVFVQNKLDAME